jgi:hypothetical protein
MGPGFRMPHYRSSSENMKSFGPIRKTPRSPTWGRLEACPSGARREGSWPRGQPGAVQGRTSPDDHRHDHDDHHDREPAVDMTLRTNRLEVLVSHPRVVAGEPFEMAVHVTRLKTALPLAKGSITAKSRGRGACRNRPRRTRVSRVSGYCHCRRATIASVSGFQGDCGQRRPSVRFAHADGSRVN